MSNIYWLRKFKILHTRMLKFIQEWMLICSGVDTDMEIYNFFEIELLI